METTNCTSTYELQVLYNIYLRLFNNNLVDLKGFEFFRSEPKPVMRTHFLEYKRAITYYLIRFAEKFDPDYLKNNANARGCKSVEQYVKKQFYYNNWFCSPKVKKRKYFKEAYNRLLAMRAWVQYDLQIVANKWYVKHRGEIRFAINPASATIADSIDTPKETKCIN